jgi:hypothetical protein
MACSKAIALTAVNLSWGCDLVRTLGYARLGGKETSFQAAAVLLI